MPTVGFLHTAEVHVATFDALVAECAPTFDVVTKVDETLLADARLHGADATAVVAAVERELIGVAGQGAEVIVCTCSTIGGVAEEVGRALGVDVVRVDRPMAERAVGLGRRLAVLAALESTLEPTETLVREVAANSDRDVEIELVVVAGAWAAFEAGDAERYHGMIAAALPDLARRSDVVVLAQASMAPVADSAAARMLGVPVLASPRTAVESLAIRH